MVYRIDAPLPHKAFGAELSVDVEGKEEVELVKVVGEFSVERDTW